MSSLSRPARRTHHILGGSKTINTCSLEALEARSLKSGHRQRQAPPKGATRGSLLASSSFWWLWALCGLWPPGPHSVSLPCGCSFPSVSYRDTY